MPFAEMSVYGATKAAVKSLTEALDIEWNQYGIRVIAMAATRFLRVPGSGRRSR